MSLEGFEEKLKGTRQDIEELILVIRNNEEFFNDVPDDYPYKPWINVVLYYDQKSYSDSDLPWCYVPMLYFKEIRADALRSNKLVGLIDIDLYFKLLYACVDELPEHFIDHYSNIIDPDFLLFWNLIFKKKYDLLKIYCDRYTWDPSIEINKTYDYTGGSSLIASVRGDYNYRENDKERLVRKMKISIECYSDEYSELLEKTFFQHHKNEIMTYKSVEINENNILEIIWKVRQDGGDMNLLNIVNYFDFMTLSERTEWWNRISELIRTKFKYVIKMSLSETFLDYVNDLIDDFVPIPQADVVISEIYVKRLLNKHPHLKKDVIIHAISADKHIGTLKYLLPNATSDDILEILNLK